MTSTQISLLEQIKELNLEVEYDGNSVSIYTQDISLDIWEALSELRDGLEDEFYTNWSHCSVELTIPRFIVEA